MRSRRLPFVGVLLTGALAAQQPVARTDEPARPLVRSTAQEVLLDVVVRDKKGRLVRDLTQDEIQVSEGGLPQKILGFRLVERKTDAQQPADEPRNPQRQTGSASPAARSTAPNVSRQIRLVSLVFERLGVDGRRLAKTAALDLLETEKDSNVFFAVFRIDQNLRVLQQFTNDRAALKKAVDRAVAGTSSDFANDLNAVNTALGQTAGSSGTAEQTAANGGTGQVNSAGLANEQIGQMLLDMQQYNELLSTEQQARASIFPLLAIVKEQEKLPGRKSVLYFSEGMRIPGDMVEQFHSVIGAANRANVSVYTVDARGLSSADQGKSARDMLQGAVRSSYAQQHARATGQQAPITRDQVMALDRAVDSLRENSQNTLAELAESTGGFLIANSNDLRTPLRKLSEDLDAYYEVTYAPHIETYDGRFRKVAVKVLRSDVKVQARNGYFALPPDDHRAIFPYEIPLLNALSAPALPHAFEFHAAALRFHAAGNGTGYELVVQVPLAGVAFAADQNEKTYQTHLSVLVLVKNADGGVVARLTRDVPFQGPLNKMELFQRGSFILTEYFELRPGRYTLEAAVADREGEKASARRMALMVPKPSDGLDMSSVSLVRRFDAEPADQAGDRVDPLRFQGGKVTPSLSSSIPGGKGASVAMYFVVYPNPAVTEKPELTLEVLEDGKAVARSATPLPEPDAQGRIPYIASSSAETLKPGQYEIRAVVSQGGKAREEHAFFAVE